MMTQIIGWIAVFLFIYFSATGVYFRRIEHQDIFDNAKIAGLFLIVAAICFK